MRLVIALVVVALAAGCGGNGDNETQANPATTTPEQDAGDFMKELTERSLRGQYGRVWETLHPAHQAFVTRDRFDTCQRDEDGTGATNYQPSIPSHTEHPANKPPPTIVVIHVVIQMVSDIRTHKRSSCAGLVRV
jgi:hypothetical protein